MTNKDNVGLVGFDERGNSLYEQIPAVSSYLTEASAAVASNSGDTVEVLAANRLAGFWPGWLLTRT